MDLPLFYKTLMPSPQDFNRSTFGSFSLISPVLGPKLLSQWQQTNDKKITICYLFIEI